MNQLRVVLKMGNDALDTYLEIAPTEEIKHDILELMRESESADVQAFKEKAINLIRNA